MFSHNLTNRSVDMYWKYVCDVLAWCHPIIYLYTWVRLLTVQMNIIRCIWIWCRLCKTFPIHENTRYPRIYYIFKINFCLFIIQRFIVTGKKYIKITHVLSKPTGNRFEKRGAKFCARYFLYIEKTVVIHVSSCLIVMETMGVISGVYGGALLHFLNL